MFKPWVMPANMDSYGVSAIIQYPFKVSNLKSEQIQKDDWNQCLEAHLSLESSKLRRKLCCCFWIPAAFFGSSPRTTFLLSPFLQAPPGTTHFLSSSSQPATPAHLPSLSPNYFLFSFFFLTLIDFLTEWNWKGENIWRDCTQQYYIKKNFLSIRSNTW